jgi:hypothetical protein
MLNEPRFFSGRKVGDGKNGEKREKTVRKTVCNRWKTVSLGFWWNGEIVEMR